MVKKYNLLTRLKDEIADWWSLIWWKYEEGIWLILLLIFAAFIIYHPGFGSGEADVDKCDYIECRPVDDYRI